jgi:hypothetical protein
MLNKNALDWMYIFHLEHFSSYKNFCNDDEMSLKKAPANTKEFKSSEDFKSI